ncbi:MAG: autotransporter-associated beta strand repeat-containing protein [Akkermansia sp.]|nr:autotransporter-associated beta strand repeat-containing protein [Akkermansia sp.]
MKFHLPLLLRKALLLSLCVCTATTVQAGIMHEDVALQTYTDFGQNRGRYAVGERVNALLQFIREEEGGITITYTDGTAPYVISNEQGMICFNGTGDGGYYAAVAPNAMATVLHNGSIDASYGERFVGSEHAINYAGIDINGTWTYRLAPIQTNGDKYDYMLQRQSKIVTDAVYNPLSTKLDITGYNGEYLYHSGGGNMKVYTEGVGTTTLCGGYQYIIGGINTITSIWSNDGPNMSVSSDPGYGKGIGASEANPLPNCIQPGDSGSPIFVYNSETQQYEYLASQQSYGGTSWAQARVNMEWTHEVLESFNSRVSMKENVAVVYLNAVNTAGETKTEGSLSTTLYSGKATDSAGNTLATYVGVRNGLNTWADLSGLKDVYNWYAYNANSNLLIGDKDLFFTNNLVFTSTTAENHIVLNDTVDLGIGYAEFNGGKFTISSASGESNLFNHGGYVINEGAEVHLKLTNPSNYMREWRKSGEGDLYIDGKGDTNALLNVGGSGTTYLQQSGGHAAYNVLANAGARVVIQDLNQIKRDFTFGSGGGELDMNGLSMDWYTSTDADGRFTINALTEEAVIANRKGQSTLTYKESGNQTYLGSFLDTKDSSLRIDYQGGGKLTLNSIHTNLSNNAASGLTVSNGTVELAGTNTVHGMGSATGTNGNRVVVSNDWHYADATMDVLVKNAATFELGTHARLIGDVVVQSGGTFIMREGVTRAQEYVEGGPALEDTSKYAAYYGHKGNVELSGGTFAVQFSDATDADISYAGKVSGTGSLLVNAGLGGGTLTLSGAIDSGITRTLTSGILFLTGDAAASPTGHKWLVQSAGQMSIDHIDMIDTASTGTLVINRDSMEHVDMSSHSGMILGAQYGTEVQYGEAGTSETLRTLTLGGGGTMLVNFVLSGNDTLTVDGRGNSVGVIKMQQIADDYRGTMNVQSERVGGRMVLDIGDYALRSSVNVKTGGVLRTSDSSISGSASVIELYGSMEYDSFTVRDGATLNLRTGGRLDSENAVTIAENGTMRFDSATLQDKVELKNGGSLSGSSSAISATGKVLVTEGSGKISASGTTMAVNGVLGAAEGATLRLENGTFNIYNGDINTDGGTLELACSAVNLGLKVSNATQSIGGTLNVVSNLTINARQTSSDYSNITHNINHLNIDNKELKIVDSSNEGNRVYNISSLTGQGSILWVADTGNAGASRMVLSGDNSFSGTLILDHEDNNAGSAQHVSLAHDNAAKNLVINMWGDSDSRPGLAVSTENARVAAIGGTTNSFVYAGEVKAFGNGNNPTSTVLNTLTLDTKGRDHTYNGTLLGDATNGLNIVKTGSGSQIFTNAANVVHNVTALEGHLNFSSTTTVHGDIFIAQGAQLTLKEDSSGLRLGTGQTLNIIGGVSGQSATLNSKLYAEGGTINFGAYDSTAYSLHLAGGFDTSGTPAFNISFSNIESIERGTRYLLADGNWSGMAGSVYINLGGYLNADFNYSSQGLSVIFSEKSGYTYWNGSAEGLNSQSHVIFGSNDINSATLAESYTVGGLYFANEDTFTVSTENDATLSTGYMEISEGGTLVLDAALKADSLRLIHSNTLTGSGELHAREVEILKGEQISVDGLNMIIDNRIAGEGWLRVENGSSLQVGNNAGGNVHLLDGSSFVASGGSVSTNLKLGENEVDSRVSLVIGNGSGVALNGAVTVLGNTTLSVQGTGELQYHSSFNNLAALELRDGSHLTRDTELGIHLILDGGSATFSGDDNRILVENVTVKNGGTLTFTGTGADIIDFEAVGKTLAVSGGTIDFGTTRQTIGEWTIQLSDGALLTGQGNATYGAMDFHIDDSTIYAVSGESTISAVTRLRDGNNLNYDVSAGATLVVDGRIHSDGVAGAGSITKVGDGKLVLAGANTYQNTTTVNRGILSTATKGALSKSNVVVNSGGTLLIEGDDNQALDTNVTVKSGGKLAFDGTGFNMLDYDQTGKILLVEGGTIDFGTTCQTMGSWTLKLSNGAKVTGRGDESYGAMDFNINNSTIYATSGNSTISAVTRLRDGNNLNYDVSEGATLTVNGMIHADGVEGSGTITKVGAGKLVLNGSNTYENTTTVNAGILSTSAKGGLSKSEVIVNSGATLLIEGNNNKALGANVTINAGGLLSFAGTGSDMMDYGVSDKMLTAIGSIIDFGSTRQTMGAWSITLSNGASVIGQGNATYGALDYNTSGSTIYAISGNNTVSAVTRLRNGSSLNYNVSDGATLTIDGLIHADGAADKGSITKEGDGTLVLAAANTYANTTTINGGILSTSVKGALGGSRVVINDGGTLLIGGSDNQLLQNDITINTGGTLRFAGSGINMLDYTQSGKTLAVTGGMLDLGSTCQLMGGWSLNLSEGASVIGQGNASQIALEFDAAESTIYATSGDNTLSVGTRLGEGNNLKFDISEGASITVNKAIRAAGNNALTMSGAGSLVLTTANNFSNITTINGGTLSTSVVGALGSAGVLINSGGTLLVGGDNNKLLGEDITINAGGTLRFAGTGADIINYDKSGKSLTVAGGTVDFGSTRQTMGNWLLTLSNGATITGLGNETYGALDFNLNNSTIYATSGENTVSAVTRLRNGHNLNYDISAGATLTVDGAVRADGGGSLTKVGDGTLVLSAANTYTNTTTINGGTLSVTAKGALGSSRAVVNSGGILLVEGSDNQVLESNVTINAGGTLRFDGSGYDMLDYTQPGKTLTVAGGTIDFGSTQQTMGDWMLKLSNGASLTGRGNATYGAMDFDIDDSTIYALSGESTISAVTRLRDGHNLNYEVNSGATLTVSGAIRADGNGSLTKEGDGTLELSAANTYTNTTTINGGTLSSSVVGALGTSTVVINDGGTLLVGGDNNKLLGENVTINTGGTLRFAGTGTDILNYDKTGKTLTVAGGTIDFGSTRQTMGGWNIELSDGATLTGQGNATYGAIDFNNNNSTIYATSGDSTISAVTRLRNGNNLNYDVSEGATLTVSGLIHAAGSGNKGSITKCGDGQMIISGALNLNYLSTRDGEVVLTGTQHTVNHVDGAMTEGRTAEGTLRLAQNARLQITGNIWGRSNTGIFLDSGAELDISGKHLTISNRSEEVTSSLAATTVNGPGEYSLNRADYEISNAHVTYTGGNATINNKLTNSSIENAGTGILKVDNAENTLSGVHATGGSMKLFSAAELDLKELEIATSMSVSAYMLQSENTAQVAQLNVSGIASFGTGVTLNADLVMENGATLQMADTVQMGGDWFINGTLTLQGGMLEQILTADAGEKYALFTGVDNLYLNGTKFDHVSLGNTMSASVFFSGLENNPDRYYWLTYNSVSSGEGVLSIQITDTFSVPEPTTSTLGLLALAALVARRRRK